MRSAFTLVELLAATALSALLAVTVLGVASSIVRTNAALDRSHRAATWDAGALDLLRFDLANARRVEITANGLVLDGFGSLHPGSVEPSHRAARVTYELRELGGRRWLVRTQRVSGLLNNDAGWSEPLTLDVAALECEVLGHDPAESSGEYADDVDGLDGSPSELELEELGLPTDATGPTARPVLRLRVRLTPVDAALPAIEEVLVVG